jgi:hypothetical protein
VRAIGHASEFDELVRVCLHEYAHLAVARELGACGYVTIRRVDGAGSRFAGCFQMFGELADSEWRVVALAGAVAECMADGCVDDAAIAERVRGASCLLSGVDAALADGHTADDLALCAAIVRRAWTGLVREAEEQAAASLPAAAAASAAAKCGD